MRTRIDQYFDTTHFCEMFGISIMQPYDKEWLKVAENGQPLLFATLKEIEDKRKEYRKIKNLKNVKHRIVNAKHGK